MMIDFSPRQGGQPQDQDGVCMLLWSDGYRMYGDDKIWET